MESQPDWEATNITRDTDASHREVTASTPILLVEDDVPLLRANARQLRRLGHAVVTAASVAEARRLTGNFAVALLDIDLGDGSGVALARELIETGRIARCVFHTGCTDERTLADARALGPVVPKPTPFAVLLDALRPPPGSAT